MAHHVFAWVSGFGWTLMPHAPFRFEQIPGEPRRVIVWHEGVWGRRSAQVVIAPDGESFSRTRIGLTLFPRLVVDVFRGAARPHISGEARSDRWRIDNEIFSIDWPEGFAFESCPDFPPPFELVGADEARLWIQGPVETQVLPPLEEMKSDDQEVVAVESCGEYPLVELRYEHGGKNWRMFHVVVPRDPVDSMVVSAQTLESGRSTVRAAVERVATSFIFHPHPEPASE